MIIGRRNVRDCHGGTLSCRTPANQWLSVPRAQHGAIPGAHGQLDRQNLPCAISIVLGSGRRYRSTNIPVAEAAASIKDDGKIMHDQFSNAQQIRKPAVVSKGGIVAAQSRKPPKSAPRCWRPAATASMR